MSIISPMRNPMRGAIGLEAPGGPSYTPGEQVTNNDFETGDLSGWTNELSTPNSYNHYIGLYGTDAPNVGWPSASMTGFPPGSQYFVATTTDNSTENPAAALTQSFSCPENVPFTLSCMAGGSFGTSPDYSTFEATFKDGGGVPIIRIFRNTMLLQINGYQTKTYIRKLDNGFISGGVWTELFSSFSFSCYYDISDKTKILWRDQSAGYYKLITATGGWDVDDLAYGVAVGAFTEDLQLTSGVDSISNVFYPQWSKYTNVEVRKYSDNWMCGVHLYQLASRTAYTGTLSDVTPAGTATCDVRLEHRRPQSWTDNVSFVLS